MKHDVTIDFAHGVVYDLVDVDEDITKKLTHWADTPDGGIIKVPHKGLVYRFNREYLAALVVNRAD